MALQAEVDPDIKILNTKQYLNYLQYKTVGSALNYLKGKKSEQRALIVSQAESQTGSNKNLNVLKIIAYDLIKEFLGIENRETAASHSEQKAKYMLNNIRLCDMCYFAQFACEYTEYYYQIPTNDQKIYKDLFIDKLPHPVNHIIKKQFQTNIQSGIIADTLGGIITTVNEWITIRCTESRVRYLTNNAVACCQSFEQLIPQQFGCDRYTPGQRRRPL